MAKRAEAAEAGMDQTGAPNGKLMPGVRALVFRVSVQSAMWPVLLKDRMGNTQPLE